MNRTAHALLGSSFLLLVFTPALRAQDAAAGRAAAGEHLFKQYCASCHSTEPDKKILGPSLHAELKGPHPKKTADEVKTIIVNGKNVMPPVGAQFSPQDLNDLLAYLRTQ